MPTKSSFEIEMGLDCTTLAATVVFVHSWWESACVPPKKRTIERRFVASRRSCYTMEGVLWCGEGYVGRRGRSLVVSFISIRMPDPTMPESYKTSMKPTTSTCCRGLQCLPDISSGGSIKNKRLFTHLEPPLIPPPIKRHGSLCLTTSTPSSQPTRTDSGPPKRMEWLWVSRDLSRLPPSKHRRICACLAARDGHTRY